MRVLLALDGSEMSEAAIRTVGPWFSELGCEAVLLTVLDPDRLHQTYERTSAPLITPQAAPSGTPLRLPQETRRTVEDRGQMLERARTDATEYLESCAAQYLKDVIAKPLVEWTDQAAEGILAAADRERADLIVVGTHGRSGLSRLVMGSVAEELVRRSPVPVLPIRAGMRALSMDGEAAQ